MKIEPAMVSDANNRSADTAAAATTIATASSSDVAQHCLLFPTYATRHSRSGSKDPLDWNIRIRGWAFSKRSNRRTRLVMAMARKIAGVTKDNKVHEILDSRIGMFLASNTQGAHFAIQCVGVASTNHMEIAEEDTAAATLRDDTAVDSNTATTGNSSSDDDEGKGLGTTVDVLRRDLARQVSTPTMISAVLAHAEVEVAAVAEEVMEDREMFRRSLELGGLFVSDDGGKLVVASVIAEQDTLVSKEDDDHAHIESKEAALDADTLHHTTVTRLKMAVKDKKPLLNIRKSVMLTEGYLLMEQEHVTSPEETIAGEVEKTVRYQPGSEIPLSTLASAGNERSLPGRLGKGAASLVKNVIKRCKPGTANADERETIDSTALGATSSRGSPSMRHAGIATGSDSSMDDETAPNHIIRPRNPIIPVRAASGQSTESESLTVLEDLGHGAFPTIHVSSRPGGHFGGTLRVSHEEVEALANETGSTNSSQSGHPKFLRLQGRHDDTQELSHGVVNLIDPVGISIISDIDDTIKETNVTAGARVILRNTFLRAMQEVPGMATVYKHWWTRGAAFHYVSNSPWQLIPSLLEFFHTHLFPPGSAHLRLHDSVLKTYFAAAPPGEHKRRSIRELLMDFPERKFILVGDSGEIDMEIYTEMALEHPGQVVKIFIRDLSRPRARAAESLANAEALTQQQFTHAGTDADTELDLPAPQHSQVSSTRTSPSLKNRSFSSLLIPGNKSGQNGANGSANNSTPGSFAGFFAGRRGSVISTISDASGATTMDNLDHLPMSRSTTTTTAATTATSSPTEEIPTAYDAEDGLSLGPKMEPSSPPAAVHGLLPPLSLQNSPTVPSSPVRSPRHIFSRVRATTSSSLVSSSISSSSPPMQSRQTPGTGGNNGGGGAAGFKAMVAQSSLAMRRFSASSTNLLMNLGNGNSSTSSLADQETFYKNESTITVSNVSSISNSSSDNGADGGSTGAITIMEKKKKSGWNGFRGRRGSISPGSPLSSSLTMSMSNTEEDFVAFSGASPHQLNAYPFPAVGSYPATNPDTVHHGYGSEPAIDKKSVKEQDLPTSSAMDANDSGDLDESRSTPQLMKRSTTGMRLSSFANLFSTSPSKHQQPSPSSFSTSPFFRSSIPGESLALAENSTSYTNNNTNGNSQGNNVKSMQAEASWLERVERCKKRLPNPEMLSLFEDAEEMNECSIVLELFQSYEVSDMTAEE
ncbi:hypothetical protein BGZ83_008954 [Gryganskiella cystojenkinii]|nr:hypothetical protein BGZ83_008954 [Gryganskiella cystojenkinii]